MCITQLLKTLSFSSTLPISDSSLFFGNYGLVTKSAGLNRSKTETAWRWRLALSWETGQLASNALRKKEHRSHKTVPPAFCLRSSWDKGLCILHFPLSYPITAFPLFAIILLKLGIPLEFLQSCTDWNIKLYWLEYKYLRTEQQDLTVRRKGVPWVCAVYIQVLLINYFC